MPKPIPPKSSPELSKQDRAFHLAAAIAKIKAYRIDPNEWTGKQWAYFSSDTDSYWLVTSDELLRLSVEFDLDLTKWEEATEGLAQEASRKSPPVRVS